MPPRAARPTGLRTRAGIGNAGDIRRLNLERVLAIAMDRHEPFTRAELIQATGLSAPTVGSLASQLIRSGLVRDLGTAASRGGRRPTSMEFNTSHGFVAGIDLGPTRTRLAVADLRGARLGHRVVPTPLGLDPAALLKRLAEDVRELLAEAQVPRGRLVAVGAGAPGAVDRERGVVTLASNLPGWSQVPMREILMRTLGAPVVVENDVNLAILGEHWRGAAVGHGTCAFISVGTGIGAGILMDGALHRGHHSLAGEIGLMCMGPQFVGGDRRTQGSLESLAGLKALASRWPPGAGSDPERWVAELFDAAEAGDSQARGAVDEVATLIGIATANLSVVLDPSLIVLGGAAVAKGTPFLQEVRRIVGRIMLEPTEIVVSALGKEAPLWGSLLVATNEAQELLRRRLRQAWAAS
jgi:predicted NBD/HSP70 family sugar kinase